MSEHFEYESARGDLVEAEHPTCQAVSDSADESLTVIDDLVRSLQAATVKYRHRPLDWGDVASLRQVQDQLGCVVKGFRFAETAASTDRAARQVATDRHRFRQVDKPIDERPIEHPTGAAVW
jgi:hypothetical protein